MKTLTTIIAAALLCSCANLQQWQQTLGTPVQVQADVSVLGALAKPHIPANAQNQIHKWASQLSTLADLNTAQLVAMIPKTGSATADALIASSSAFLNMALAKWGEHNATTLSYAHAVANGLLYNF